MKNSDYKNFEEFKRDLKEGKVVVNCRTKKEALLFCEWMYNDIYTWVEGESYRLEHYWDKYKQDTCYGIGEYSKLDGLYITVRRKLVITYQQFNKLKEVKLMTKFENVQVGDKVYSVILGEGVVVRVDWDVIYPILASFGEDVERSYTLEGKILITIKHPDLYWANGYQPPTDDGEPNRLPKYKKGQVIFVTEEECPVIFSHYSGCFVVDRDGDRFLQHTDVNPYLKEE